MSPGMLFLMRMRGILRKEMLQIRRDPSSIALAILLPIALLFIFGYGVSLDAENVPVGHGVRRQRLGRPRTGGPI